MKPNKVNIPTPEEFSPKDREALPDAELKDRILGAIVGSAIGDAMGASTEMWHRNDIQSKFGYITELTEIKRAKSPEGIWNHNMSPGSTTDDTRWKYLVAQYIQQNKGALSDEAFASFIATYYQQLVDEVSDEASKKSTVLLDERMEKVNWIKEWARVALKYGESPADFFAAHHSFYGGEMSCAGMLYSPVFGLIARNADQAYLMAFEHSLFDIGYARDISALVSVMTFNALYEDSMDSLFFRTSFVDPHHYTDSRLVGRLSVSMLEEARSIVQNTGNILTDEKKMNTPNGYPGNGTEWYRQVEIYKKLDTKQQQIAFHAGEIWQILVAGLEFGQGDFERTIQFIINYGRDNDTVAAVAGMILGAHLGYEQLPGKIKEEVMKVSRETMGLDLEMIADQLFDACN
ncbi:ADP-ribosylglycohydrolase family protein [Portibacter marinus]|uniref:ADP-ribosylglycohydrolase family protein n=1 Tax=Portibacter marinus TaxID=2898660 RepID=UPI001F381720|nr:ADP-ribosylglycohydrolase family protein [Portibacter marinus]